MNTANDEYKRPPQDVPLPGCAEAKARIIARQEKRAAREAREEGKKHYNLPLTERIRQNVEADPENGGCWECTLDPNCTNWYKRIKVAGKGFPIQVASYMAFLNNDQPIPEGWYVIQECFNGWCCNPKHLRLVAKEEYKNFKKLARRKDYRKKRQKKKEERCHEE